MDNLILLNTLILGFIAFVSALILYLVSKKFKVETDETTIKIVTLVRTGTHSDLF